MKKSMLAATALFVSLLIHAQTDSSALLSEATKKLAGGVAVSELLSDTKYLPVHPLTSFRDLVKQHASTAVLTITTADEPGKKIKVLVEVKNKAGRPLAGALVYLYQTDARGWYAADAPHVLQNEGDMRHARLFGYVKTDASGQFELHTIKPSGYPRSELPAHIHVHVYLDGYRSFVTEFLFDDDERLVGDTRKRAEMEGGMIAKPGQSTGDFEQQFTYTITLQKD